MTPIGAEAARASAGPGARRALGLAWRLARRELRAGLRGFQVFLLCLVLGVGTIAAVGSLSRAMLGGLEENGRALLGGDIEVRLIHRPAAPEQLAWLENNADRLTRGADMRAMARAETPQQSRRLVELKAVDEAYPLYGAVISETAGDPLPLEERDGLWGALVQPSLLPRLGIEIGDRLRIGDLSYEVRGTILREPDRAAQAFTLGPRVLIHRESLAAIGLEQPGSLSYYHYRVALPLEESPAAWRVRLEEAFPEAGWQVRDISNPAPGLDRFIIQVTLFMTLVGLTALLIGGLGIANAVQAYL